MNGCPGRIARIHVATNTNAAKLSRMSRDIDFHVSMMRSRALWTLPWLSSLVVVSGSKALTRFSGGKSKSANVPMRKSGVPSKKGIHALLSIRSPLNWYAAVCAIILMPPSRKKVLALCRLSAHAVCEPNSGLNTHRSIGGMTSARMAKINAPTIPDPPPIQLNRNVTRINRSGKIFGKRTTTFTMMSPAMRPRSASIRINFRDVRSARAAYGSVRNRAGI